VSGPHSAYRTPSKRLFDDEGHAVFAINSRGRLKLSRVTTVIEQTRRGKPLRYGSQFVPAQRHVLDYRPPLTPVSKHRAGRTKPMTGEELRIRTRFNRLHTQASKTRTLDANALAAADA
jgi:hypothetical protein